MVRHAVLLFPANPWDNFGDCDSERAFTLPNGNQSTAATKPKPDAAHKERTTAPLALGCRL